MQSLNKAIALEPSDLYCDIFNADLDRQLFVDRFLKPFPETGVRCHAWALLSNLLHLLLMPTATLFSYFMRSLLTGYYSTIYALTISP